MSVNDRSAGRSLRPLILDDGGRIIHEGAQGDGASGHGGQTSGLTRESQTERAGRGRDAQIINEMIVIKTPVRAPKP
jgi:hypothetical protein